MLTSETKRRIDAARNVLVGKLPLPTDQVELITLALIYKFMDDLDEDSVKIGGKRSFFTGELAKYRWRNLLPQTVSAEDRVTLFSKGIESLGDPKKAAHLPGLFRDIFRNAFLKFRDGRILTLFLIEINGFSYSHSEELGNAFEYLLQCMGTQGENGQFRTPRHIIDFIVRCLDPHPDDRILDPACGTGGFLVSAYRHILAQHTSPGSTNPGDLLKHAQRKRLYANLAGYDITDLMVKLSKVNLFLHGFPDPAIHIYDTLSNDARWNEKADLILANPPFMTPKGGVTPHTKFRITAKKAEVLFTDYIAEHLSSDGRGGVIVPNGIIATTQNAYVKLRRFLVEDSLVAVVSLPAGVFKPYSGVKTSILFFDKRIARQTKEILFLKIAADGFDLGDKRNPVETNDLPDAERVIKAWFRDKLAADTPTSVRWKCVDKNKLQTQPFCSLQVDNSGSEALGECTYQEVALGELCEVLDSRRRPITKSDRKPGVVPYYGATGVVDHVEGYLFDEPLVLVGEDGAKWGAGEESAFAITGKTWVNNHAHVLRPDRTRVLDPYLIAVLNRLDLSKYVTGVTVPKLNQANLREIPIPLPSLEEQRGMVAEIEGYRKIIDGARQILASYKPHLADTSEWETVNLEDVCEIKRGRFSHRPRNAPQFYGGKYPFLQTGDVVRANGGAVAHIQTLNELGLAVSKLFAPPVVLITIAANIGDTALLTYPACFTDSVVGLIPNERILPKFLELAMRGKKEYLNALAPQAAQKNITVEVLKELAIPLPALEEQRRIVAEFDAEAAQMDVVRSLIPRYEAKIQKVLDRVWGTEAAEAEPA